MLIPGNTAEQDVEWAFRSEVVILRNQSGLTASSLCQSNKIASLTLLGREIREIPVIKSIWTLSKRLIWFLWSSFEKDEEL